MPRGRVFSLSMLWFIKSQLCISKGWYNILEHLTQGSIKGAYGNIKGVQGSIKGAYGNIKGVQGSIKGALPEYVMACKGSTMPI